MRHAGARCASGGEKAVARGRLKPYAGKSLAGGRGEGTHNKHGAHVCSTSRPSQRGAIRHAQRATAVTHREARPRSYPRSSEPPSAPSISSVGFYGVVHSISDPEMLSDILT